MHSEGEAPEITQRAFAALNGGDLDEAQNLAHQLRDLRYSSYFELQALIHLDKEALDEAIEVLREGVELIPDVWLLWQLLGNCLSDKSQFDEALRCYDRALELDLDESERISIGFNQATVLSRLDCMPDALALLDSFDEDALNDEPLLGINIELLRMSLWSDSNRRDDVGVRAGHVERLLHEMKAEPDDDFRARAEAWSRGARTLLKCGFEARARAWALQSLDIFVGDSTALTVLRLSDPKAPQAKRTFDVLLEGVMDEESGFFVSYSVVARNAREAEQLALAMETPRHEQPLAVSECKAMDKCDKTPIGVYYVGPYNTFPLDAEE